MIYSSITPYVHMLYTAEDEQEHIELDFSGERRRRNEDSMFGYDSFGVSLIKVYTHQADYTSDLEYPI
jgi:WD repeat-containing protein 23